MRVSSQLMNLIWFFAIGLVCTLFFSRDVYDGFLGIVAALTCSLLLITIARKLKSKHFSYILFFSISITSVLGLTSVLTGSHASGSSYIFYGLSFYTASIAYLNSKNTLELADAIKVSNPIFLFTGPIALFAKPIKYRSIRLRVVYFLPFLVIGFFYFQIVAAPLSAYMFLLHKTDAISSLIFAVIFEIFVYYNFCGLSLVVYSISGMVGYRIPLNFRQPFSATNLVDFWKGWHTSLSTVLKELFYKPAKSRVGSFGALLLVYVSSAIWHGVTFNFILWGLFHAICFYLTVRILKLNIKFRYLITLPLMVFGIIIGRLVFADSNTDRLIEKLYFKGADIAEFGELFAAPQESKIALLFGLILISCELALKKNRFVKKRNYKHLRTPFSQFVLILCIIMLSMNVGGDFAIYGQR